MACGEPVEEVGHGWSYVRALGYKFDVQHCNRYETSSTPLSCALARSHVLWPPHAGMAPYRAAFGQDARVGISRLPLDAALLEGLSSEAELVQALGAKGDCYLEEVQLEAEVPSSSSKSGRRHEKAKPLKRSQVVVLDEESEGEVVEGSVHAALGSGEPINVRAAIPPYTCIPPIRPPAYLLLRTGFRKLKRSFCKP